MRPSRHFQHVLAGTSALIFAGAQVAPSSSATGPVLEAAAAFVSPPASPSANVHPTNSVAAVTHSALVAFTNVVRPLSHPQALESAFHSYFAFRAAHADDVRKPYLYFVDYGLASTQPRGYVFDMEKLTIVDGPFTVAHGRGSSVSQYGVPTRFSNYSGSSTTSLGLYVAQSTYDFHGHAGGGTYSALGMRLQGVSRGFNDQALARGVVAHGAPYVTATKAGRSQGCPAMEPARAQRLLPKLADGGLVFLFAPDATWLQHDPWVSATTD